MLLKGPDATPPDSAGTVFLSAKICGDNPRRGWGAIGMKGLLEALDRKDHPEIVWAG